MPGRFRITAFRRPEEDAADASADNILAVVSKAYSITPDLTALASRPLDSATPHRVYEIRFSTANTTGEQFKLAEFRDRSDGVLDSVEEVSGFDLVFQSLPADDDAEKSPPRLAVFDMDSTLIRQEVIDLLAAHAGVSDKVSAITARAMNGELDFYASLRERVALLQGIPAGVFEELKLQLTLTPGAERLLAVLNALGTRTALLSGGFLPLARFVAARLGIEHVHANSLAVDSQTQTLTGRLEEGAEVVHAERKRELLLEMAAAHGIDLGRVMAVGDGANDLPMMRAAGLGVAVHAKPKVQREAPVRLNGDSLADLLYLMGYSEAEADELARGAKDTAREK